MQLALLGSGKIDDVLSLLFQTDEYVPFLIKLVGPLVKKSYQLSQFHRADQRRACSVSLLASDISLWLHEFHHLLFGLGQFPLPLCVAIFDLLQ